MAAERVPVGIGPRSAAAPTTTSRLSYVRTNRGAGISPAPTSAGGTRMSSVKRLLMQRPDGTQCMVLERDRKDPKFKGYTVIGPYPEEDETPAVVTLAVQVAEFGDAQLTVDPESEIAGTVEKTEPEPEPEPEAEPEAEAEPARKASKAPKTPKADTAKKKN